MIPWIQRADCRNLAMQVIGVLKCTLSITEGADVVGSILLIHSLSSKAFSDHITNNSQHGCTSVVQFCVEFGCFLLWVLYVSTKVSYTVVSVILRGRHPRQFNESKKGKNLCNTLDRDGFVPINTSWNIREFKVIRR